MADICILYARDDAAFAPPALEAFLSPDWSVWWDAKIIEGDYRKAIENALSVCHCVIPVWSRLAPDSPHIHDELDLAKRFGASIIPLKIHDAPAPMGHGVLQATNIIDWAGNLDRQELHGFRDRVRAVLESRTPDKRPRFAAFGESVELPAFFYSVSSHETRLDPPAALKALNVFGARTILVSAYDTETGPKSGLIADLKRRRRAGATILLDSGNYEKARSKDETWTEERFHAALAYTPHDFAFSYDILNPNGDADKVARAALRGAARTSKATSSPVIPIVHLPRSSDGEYAVGMAGAVMRRVAQDLRPPMIAIPERELGAGIFTRAQTMLAIRSALNGIGWYQPVHVLGAGNPVSLALLSAAGADSFDGLEWCRYVVDAEHATLHHFQLFEMFQYQAQLAASLVTSSAIEDENVHYAGRAVLHNLDFYEAWLADLRLALTDEKRLVEFMTDLLPKGAMKQARAALPGVL